MLSDYIKLVSLDMGIHVFAYAKEQALVGTRLCETGTLEFRS